MLVKKFLVIWVDKFGLEWSDEAWAADEVSATNSFKWIHPECRQIKLTEL